MVANRDQTDALRSPSNEVEMIDSEDAQPADSLMPSDDEHLADLSVSSDDESHSSCADGTSMDATNYPSVSA